MDHVKPDQRMDFSKRMSELTPNESEIEKKELVLSYLMTK